MSTASRCAGVLAEQSPVDPGTELIVTGDLTAFGAPRQFQEADDYFGKVSRKPPYLGLGRPDWALRSVPGNHDFWSGVACVGWGFTNSEVRERYPEDAWITSALTLPYGLPLAFLHLNGDADVKPMSPERVYACGSFCSAIRRLDSLLAKRTAPEVRILLLHHSVQYEVFSAASLPARLPPGRNAGNPAAAAPRNAPRLQHPNSSVITGSLCTASSSRAFGASTGTSWPEHGLSRIWKTSGTSPSLKVADASRPAGQLAPGFLAIDLIGEYPERGNAIIAATPSDPHVRIEAQGGHDGSAACVARCR